MPSMTAVEIARAAALKRQSDRAAIMSEGSRKVLEKREKATVIGKIEECYAKMDKVRRLADSCAAELRQFECLILFQDPPIGLAAAKLESLHRHLGYVKTQVHACNQCTSKTILVYELDSNLILGCNC
jgi:hypothetical protein